MLTYDFSRSYFRFRVDLKAQPAITLSHVPPTTVNNVRINLECRCALTDRKTGRTTIYALGASCKTERVGGPGDLWLLPNGDFCPVVSDEYFLITKSWQKKQMGVMRNPPSLGEQPERQIGLVDEAWVNAGVTFREVAGRRLETIEEIIAGIRGDQPLVSRTEYSQGDYDVVIDHPVKTINYSERESVFQTDTGPILLPDLSPERIQKEEALIGCFDLAYSAFNATDWAEFIVNAPTELSPEISVNHYSQPRRIEGTRNAIIEVLG
jgi:hypothetical protein